MYSNVIVYVEIKKNSIQYSRSCFPVKGLLHECKSILYLTEQATCVKQYSFLDNIHQYSWINPNLLHKTKQYNVQQHHNKEPRPDC